VTDIAVLGASSSIFQSLLAQRNFVRSTDKFHLFTRRPEDLAEPMGEGQFFLKSLDDFKTEAMHFEEIFNFIGTGNPSLGREHLVDLGKASLRWDFEISRMLKRGQARRYYSMSSGIAAPAYENKSENIYRDIKLELERRHQEDSMAISDIRIYGFADSSGKFFPGSLVGDLSLALASRSVFETDTEDVVRDYCGGEELVLLLTALRNNEESKGISELYSLSPVSKNQLLETLMGAGLLAISVSASGPAPISGRKLNYVPAKTENCVGYSPRRSSLEVVLSALEVKV